MVSIHYVPGYMFECSSSCGGGDGGGGSGDGGVGSDDGGNGDGRDGYSGSRDSVCVGGCRTTQMCEISLIEGTW